MQIPTNYQAEITYRQDQIRRDWEPIRQRRRARALGKAARRSK